MPGRERQDGHGGLAVAVEVQDKAENTRGCTCERSATVMRVSYARVGARAEECAGPPSASPAAPVLMCRLRLQWGAAEGSKGLRSAFQVRMDDGSS